MTKKGNMFGNFETAAEQRQQEQAQIEAAVTGSAPAAKKVGRVKKRGEGSTSITLSISSEDKERVREIAMRRGVAISDLLHYWIEQNYNE